VNSVAQEGASTLELSLIEDKLSVYPGNFNWTVCPHCGGHVRVIAAIIRKETTQEILGI
jgi:hypothetical protein